MYKHKQNNVADKFNNVSGAKCPSAVQEFVEGNVQFVFTHSFMLKGWRQDLELQN